MLRKLIDYKKLSPEVTALLVKSYPHGYGDEDIVVFKNMHGEVVEAVEVKTEEVVYLVKISTHLNNFITNFDVSIEKNLECKPKKIDESKLDGLELSYENECNEHLDNQD